MSDPNQAVTIDSAEPSLAARPPTNKASRTGRRTVRLAASWTALAIAVTIFMATSLATLSGDWQLTPVLTGSMVPILPVGSLAISQKEPLSDLRVGQIALLHPPGAPQVTYVHKVVWLSRVSGATEIRTRGVANPIDDPWTVRVASPQVYVVRYDMPGVGYASLWLRSPQGRATSLLTAGLLSLALVALVIRDEMKKRRGQGPRRDNTPLQADS